MAESKRIAIFDLDGTILDTIGDITASANRALSALGYKRRTVAEIRSFIGNGALVLMSRAAGLAPESEECRKLRMRFTQEYREHPFDNTRPYDGIAELIEKLNSRGVFVAVVSNKDDECVQTIIPHFFGGNIKISRGVRVESERKPNPEPTLALLALAGFTPSETVFIGDGKADFLTAQNCGIDHIPVGYGYTDPSVLFDLCGRGPFMTVSDLAEYLDSVF